jgi:hypothetical protein
MLLKRNVSPNPNPTIAAKITKNNASALTLTRPNKIPLATIIGNITTADAKLLITFDQIGSTFLRAFAESTVEIACISADKIARTSPIIFYTI